MQHVNLLLALIALSGLLPATLVRSQEKCVTPIGEQGVCIGIRECQPLLKILRTYGTSAGNFLRSALCANDDSNHIVCCPDASDSFPSPFPTPDLVLDSDSVSRGTTTGAPQRSEDYGPIYEPACGVSNLQLTRIVNGVPATLGSWPWMVALGYLSERRTKKTDWKCGGSLISSRHVLTAAHCVTEDRSLYVARLGDLDLNESVNDGASPVDVLIDQSHVHPRYSEVTYTNDIAILRLVRDVEFNDFIQPICLPFTDELRNKTFEGTLPFVAGWGEIYFRGPRLTHLQQLQIPVVEQKVCKAAIGRFRLLRAIIDQRVICTGFPQGGKDSCRGDSGGPLMYPKRTASNNRRFAFYAVGIVSYGIGCAQRGNPGVYTRVTEFLSFIQSHLN